MNDILNFKGKIRNLPDCGYLYGNPAKNWRHPIGFWIGQPPILISGCRKINRHTTKRMPSRKKKRLLRKISNRSRQRNRAA